MLADSAEADTKLRKRFGFTEKQSDAILNMRLAKLTGLEIEKLDAELKEIRTTIKALQAILKSKPKRMKILLEEMNETVERCGDDRRTEIIADQVETVRVSDELNVDMAPDGTIYGIELLNANRQLRADHLDKLVVVNEESGESREIELPV